MSGKKYQVISFNPRRTHNFEQASVLAKIFGKKFLHVTSIYFNPATIALVNKIAPGYSPLLSRRSYPHLPSSFVKQLPVVELKKKIRELRGKKVDFLQLSSIFQREIVNNIAPPEICISFDTSSHIIFRQWKGKAKLILDLGIGMPQYRVKLRDGDRYNEYTLSNERPEMRELFRIYNQEVVLADVILCGSEFVKQTVKFVDPALEEKCRVLPYGVDVAEFGFPDRKFEANSRLKFVYVGIVGWRKGADILLKAWEQYVTQFPESELHFWGNVDSEIDITVPYKNTFFHGNVHKDILIEHLKKMDVFVLPTTFEGSSLAIYQAMAMKLPVITTFNSGTVLKPG